MTDRTRSFCSAHAWVIGYIAVVVTLELVLLVFLNWNF